jgi:hypothetical protein
LLRIVLSKSYFKNKKGLAIRQPHTLSPLIKINSQNANCQIHDASSSAGSDQSLATGFVSLQSSGSSEGAGQTIVGGLLSSFHIV